MIRRCEFESVLTAVQGSNAAAEIDALVNPTRTGRPRRLRTDVFLTALIACVLDKNNLSMVNVHKLLTRDLATSFQTHLGIRGGGHTLTLRQLRYLLTAIAERLTPDVRLDDGETAEDIALDRIANLILAASIPAHLPTPTAYAMDSTAVHSWARDRWRTDPDNPGVKVRASVDPDAAGGYCTKTQDNRSNWVFGFALFTVTGVPDVGAAADSMPILTRQMLLRPANSDVAAPGLTVLDDLIASGTPVAQVLCDRAWSYLTADRWAEPLRERGIEQVFDLHPADRGARDHNGLLMIDGAPHCPATPNHLHNIARPSRFSLEESPPQTDRAARADDDHRRRELDAFTAAIAERQKYAFRRVQGPDPTGKERWECPAQAGKIACERCPLSMLGPTDLPIVEEPPAPATAPSCCTQRTITIAGDVLAKLRQRLAWGTLEWILSYSRRTYVEGAYGNLKSAKTENIRRGWCFVWGRAKTTLLLAVAIAASNIRLLRAWSKRTGDITDPLTTPDPEGHGFEEVDADGNPLRPTGPPGAAAA